MSGHRIVIVGASVAGVQAAESLRAGGYDGELTLLEAQRELPYNRPPLSKELLTGELDEDDIRLLTTDLVEELSIDLRLGCPASHLDLMNSTVTADGDVVGYDQLVIATGAAPIMPAAWSGIPGVVGLRTIEDARAIQAVFSAGATNVVVVGGGFIGCEIAAVASQRGLRVTIVEAQSHLMGRALTPEAAAPLQAAHTSAGVRVLLGVAVARLSGSKRIEQVELIDGEILDADLVVVGIGARPVVGWLSGCGLVVGDGVHTDETLQAAPGVYAIGDVARWHDHRRPQGHRVEHWSNARAHGVLVAHNLLDPGSPHSVTDRPYVWSDQYGRRLQLAGDGLAEDFRFMTDLPAEDGYVALVGNGKHVVGAIAYAQEKLFRRARKAVDAEMPWTDIDQLNW